MAWIDKALLPGPSTAAAEASKQLKEQGFTWDWIEDSKRDITFTRLDGSQGSKVGEKDLPLYQKILDRLTVKDSNNRSWLNKGLLKDGVDKDDIWKTILASLSDAGEDILAGGLNLGESLADTSAMLLPALLEGQQKLNSKLGVAPTAEDIRILEEAKAKALAFKQKDLYDGNAVAREILSNLQSVGYMEGRGGYISEEDIAESQRLKAASKKYLDEEMESVSVLGEKLDSAAQSAGQLAVRTAVNAYVPGAGWILAAASAFDDEVDNAIEEGANFEEMMTSGAISAAAEVGIEALSGGIKIGDNAATDFLVDKLAALIPKSVLRTGMKLGIEATGEGIEEVLTDAVSKFGQWLTYRSEEELKDIFSSEQALDAAAESFWSGLLMGGAFGTVNVAQSHAAGTDFVSGLTKNEETVVRKLVNDRLAEAKKNNEKVKKSDVYNEVIEAMDNGEISTDTIEEILGGKEYRDYKQAMDAQEDNDLIEEHTNLGNKKGATPAETTRYQEIDKQVSEIRKKRSNLKDQLSFGVSELVKNDRLSESYVQKAARGRTFNVDLTKVSEKQHGIYQKAMESGVINNTRRSHQFVDLVARIAADKGIDFDFTNNERLKKSGFAVAGAHVNGYVNENGITINMQSAKVLNTVVGHEVTHVLEGTELYNELQKVLFDYAKPKGEYLPRFNAMKELYKDSFKDLDAEAFEAAVNKEVTADLVGDLLFSDADFINQLYRGNRNVFEKLYDEIKYLCKVVTAGSKEARQLEQVKKKFAEAYHGEVSKPSSVAYSLERVGDTDYVRTEKTAFLKEDGTEMTEREIFNSLVGTTIHLPDGDVTIEKRLPGKKDMYNELFRRQPRWKEGVEDSKALNSEINRNMGELLENSDLKDGNVPDMNGRHAAQGIVSFDTRIVNFYDGNKAYSLDLSIGVRADGSKVAYAKKAVVFNEELTNKIQAAEDASEIHRNNQQPVIKNIIAQNSEMSSDSDAAAAEKLSAINVEVDSKSGTVSHSLSSLEDAFGITDSEYMLDNTSSADFAQARTEYVAALSRSIALDKDNPTEEERQKAERYLNSLFLIHDMILDDRGRLDYEAAVNKSAWVSNAEYGGSIDFSTLCAKRRLFTGTFDAIQNALPDTVLDENDFLQIRQMLLDADMESPCSMCYVEGFRAKHGVYVERFLKDYLKTNPEWKPQIADFTSTTRLEQTRIQHPEAYAAYQAAMNKLSQRKPKEASVRTDYKGEILRDFKDSSNVEEKNKNGGVRFNSFSDFEIIHALDCMQVLTDMSRVGLNGQAYTKVKEFAEAFGNTGLKINLSLVAKDVGTDGKLIMDEVNGMKKDEAMDLRNRYSDNVGTVIVVFNEAQLRAALADPSIDYVLPFHRSQWKKSQYAMMGLPAETKDFTNFQNDRIRNPKTGRDVKLPKIKHTATFTNTAGESFEITDNIMPNQYWNFDLSGRENAQTYLNYINDNGMTPKFSFLLNKDSSGKWVLPDDAVGDGYFKLLIDFKMYNNDGWGVPQNPVVPDFNMSFIQDMLTHYVGGHNAFPVAHDVVTKFVDSRKAKHSLSENDIVPVQHGNFNITSEEVYLDPGKSDVAPVAANAEAQTDRAVTASAVSEKHEEEPRTPRDRAKKFFFDDVMSLDKMPEDFRKKHGEKWTALQRATESAQDLVVNGADGVKPLDEIYQRVVATNAFSRFESYMQHLLNMDAMSLNQRFGLKDKDVIGGVTAEMSRQEVAKLEKAHPEFKEIAEDIYAYNRYLRDVLVKSGKISEETADVWELRYPHYIPIKRAGFGNDFEISELLGFMIENMEQIPNAENMDGFFQKVEGTAPVKARKGSDLPIQPLFDTLTERAMQTYWAAAMTGADMHSLAPVRSDIPDQLSRTEPSTKTVVPENVQIETEKTSNPKILDVDGEIMRNGNMNPGKWFAEKILDNGFVFERISKKTGDRGLEAEWNFIRNARGAAQHLIGNGVESKGVMALHDIYSNVQKTRAVKQFYEYLGHQRNVDSMTMRVRFGLPVNQTVMGRAAADSYDAIYQLEQKHPQFKALAEETYKYAQNLLDNMVESGMLSKADADMIREVAPHWVPFNVVEGKIQPVFKTLADETLKIQHQIALNKFGVHLKNTLGTVVSERQMNLSDFLKSIDRNGNLVHFGGNVRFNTMTVLDNGKSVTFEITDEMYAALKPTRDLLSASLPVANQVSTIRRNLITAYSPWFTVKNAIRDVQEVVINSQHPVKTYAAIPQAINEIRKKGEFYQEYVRNGGEHNTYFDSETGSFGPGTGVMTALETKTGLKYILKANEFVESVPRLAEYIASREAGASVEVAMLDAARVTTNFAAGGKLTKFLDRNGATFLNASVQGAMQQARNFAEAKQNGIKGWASLAARYAVLGLPAVLLNGLIWGDDEEYQALPDYITDNYYIVGKYGQGSFIRLPKGRTAAVLQDAIEQTLKMPEREANWKSFWKLFFENIAPNNPLEDNIVAPVVQVVRNKTWYGEDLVPSRLQKIDDVTQRFDEKTSRWATWLSERIEDSELGDHVDLSPKQIHYLLDQYSGVLGDTILPFTTPKAESRSEAGNLIAPIRDIFTTNATLNNRVTGDFYDTLEAVEAQAEEPGASLSEKLMSSVLIGYNVEISKLLQQQRDIQNSKMKASEKYDKNFELKEQINALQKEALENYQNMRITGIYAEAAGKRYNYGFDKESGKNRWFEIKPKNADGTDNWYYQDEKNVTKTFGISPAEYWNNREAYSSAYYAANHWDDSYFETVRSVLGIDSFVEYAEGLTDIYADKDSKGNAISGSRKKKVKAYIYGLDIPDIEKHILYKAEYNYANKSYNKAIYKYLEGLGLSSYTMNRVLAELGMK